MSDLTAEISRDGKRIYIVGSDGTVAEVDNDDVAEGQGEKYARLFCAAPDLLAALEAFIAGREPGEVVRDARAAVARVRGGGGESQPMTVDRMTGAPTPLNPITCGQGCPGCRDCE